MRFDLSSDEGVEDAKDQIFSSLFRYVLSGIIVFKWVHPSYYAWRRKEVK
jgi:hypothetical protein